MGDCQHIFVEGAAACRLCGAPRPCAHGAWNSDGSCCTCKAPGTAPWYRHTVYPKPSTPMPPAELRAALKRYSDFVHELASREHGQFCQSRSEGWGPEHCDCIVGEAAGVVMDVGEMPHKGISESDKET